jgi:hypothetical protein
MTCDDASDRERRQRGTVAEGPSKHAISGAAYRNKAASDNAHSPMRCQLKIRKFFEFECETRNRKSVRYFDRPTQHQFCDEVAVSDIALLGRVIVAGDSMGIENKRTSLVVRVLHRLSKPNATHFS